MTNPGALAGHRIVPVVVIDDPARAVGLADALAAGGIHCAEITLRTPRALEAIAAMSAAADFTVGVGTVLTTTQLAAAVDAGARFVVSPGLDEQVVRASHDLGVDVLPGIATASEAMAAMRLGVEVVKFFPADRLGGLATIRAMAAALPGLGFVPSGGVGESTIAEYLADPAVPAVSGAWMCPASLIAAGDFDRITELAARAVTLGGDA